MPSHKLVSKLPAHLPTPFPKTPPQQGCCLQSRAWGFSAVVHISDFSPRTSFEENKIVTEQADAELANSWQASGGWRGEHDGTQTQRGQDVTADQPCQRLLGVISLYRIYMQPYEFHQHESTFDATH